MGSPFTSQVRGASVKIFQELDGEFTNINPNTGLQIQSMYCFVSQLFNVVNTNQGGKGGVNIGDGGGGVVTPVTFQANP